MTQPQPFDTLPAPARFDDEPRTLASTLLPPPPYARGQGRGGAAFPLPGWLRLVRDPHAFAAAVLDAAPVSDPDDAAHLLAPRLACEDVEVMVVLALDGRHHVLGIHEVARGGAHGLSVTAREIYRVAVALGASAIVLAHNHPSGSPEPSQEDDDTTAAVSLAGDVLGIPLVDHLVIATEQRWVSYAARGRLDRLRG
ncbi:MAG: JAB domain-containing protein [Polyangiaceae bacterium]